ncbi:unnamed protein product [Staurois parvus]|uniref:Uncharacterized protein n=1 Tax=Staurois parvus TaxID=386267 RepID=A0ABN9C324_9NEOB|nr:unnamed protein product [Staurois parvus]
MKASEKTEETIEAARGIYLPLACRGAVLYFVVADLVNLNYMYQFSLHWFHKVFVESMNVSKTNQTHNSLMSSSGTIRPLSRQRSIEKEATDEENMDIKRHLHNICDTLTRNVYKIVSSSLFTEHKLCFSFLLVVNIMRNGSEDLPGPLGFLQHAEWNFFLNSVLLTNFTYRKESAGDSGESAAPNIPKWLSGSTWRQCEYLTHHLEPFSALSDSLLSSDQQWREFCNSNNLYEFLKSPYRGEDLSLQEGTTQMSDREVTGDLGEELTNTGFHWEKLSSFQKLMLIKILRPECLTSAIQELSLRKWVKNMLRAVQ